MPIPSRYFKTAAMLICVAAIVVILVPTIYKVPILFFLYLGLLLVGLCYYQTTRKILEQIKLLDREEEYADLLIYLNQIEKKGYVTFVYDSYRLYANYVFGDFESYKKTAHRLMTYKAWQRPKNKDFRDKVMDNLSCIAFLENWANTNELNYQGDNVLIIQSLNDYKEQNLMAIQSRLETYELPQLKKACLLALSGQFEAMEEIYTNNELFKKIKERN